MKHAKWLLLSGLFILVAPLSTQAKSVVVRLSGQALTTGTSDRGIYHVVDLAIPEEISGKRLDTVMLEFYVDVAANEELDMEGFVPSIEVYPLSEAVQVGRTPRFTSSYPTSRPVALGERQRVMVDITDVVKGWIGSPETNHGLVIGSFGGPVLGGLDVRDDVIGSGTAIQATFFYQNRFGQRLSEGQ